MTFNECGLQAAHAQMQRSGEAACSSGAANGVAHVRMMHDSPPPEPTNQKEDVQPSLPGKENEWKCPQNASSLKIT